MLFNTTQLYLLIIVMATTLCIAFYSRNSYEMFAEENNKKTNPIKRRKREKDNADYDTDNRSAFCASPHYKTIEKEIKKIHKNNWLTDTNVHWSPGYTKNKMAWEFEKPATALIKKYPNLKLDLQFFIDIHDHFRRYTNGGSDGYSQSWEGLPPGVGQQEYNNKFRGYLNEIVVKWNNLNRKYNCFGIKTFQYGKFITFIKNMQHILLATKIKKKDYDAYEKTVNILLTDYSGLTEGYNRGIFPENVYIDFKQLFLTNWKEQIYHPFIVRQNLSQKLDKWISFVENKQEPERNKDYENVYFSENNKLKEMECYKSRWEYCKNENDIEINKMKPVVIYSAGSLDAEEEQDNIPNFDKDRGGYNLFRAVSNDNKIEYMGCYYNDGDVKAKPALSIDYRKGIKIAKENEYKYVGFQTQETGNMNITEMYFFDALPKQPKIAKEKCKSRLTDDGMHLGISGYFTLYQIKDKQSLKISKAYSIKESCGKERPGKPLEIIGNIPLVLNTKYGNDYKENKRYKANQYFGYPPLILMENTNNKLNLNNNPKRYYLTYSGNTTKPNNDDEVHPLYHIRAYNPSTGQFDLSIVVSSGNLIVQPINATQDLSLFIIKGNVPISSAEAKDAALGHLFTIESYAYFGPQHDISKKYYFHQEFNDIGKDVEKLVGKTTPDSDVRIWKYIPGPQE